LYLSGSSLLKNSPKPPAGHSLPQKRGPNHKEVTTNSRQKNKDVGPLASHSPVKIFAKGIRAQGI